MNCEHTGLTEMEMARPMGTGINGEEGKDGFQT
jgi:hypothetical protein